MPQTSECFPSILGFVPVRSDDAPETADSPSVGTAATVPDDLIASLDMDETLRSMLLGTTESQHVLPLVYEDLRRRLSGLTNSNRGLQEIPIRLGNVAFEHSELRQHIRRVESEFKTLRNEIRVLPQRQPVTTTPGANPGSNSTAASVAASLSAPMRTDAQTPQPPPAIAPPEPQRVDPPAHTAPMPSLVLPPPTFTEFMATVPQVATNPLSVAAPGATRSLQTACDVLMPVPTLALTGPMNGATEALGPYSPVLMPLTTLLAPFTDVISYRSYRLRNTRGEATLVESCRYTRIKRRLDDLYPGFAPFGGSPPIRLLEFVTTLQDGFNALKASGVVAALLLTYYLEGSAKTLYAPQRSSGVRSEAGALVGTCTYLIDELIKRDLTDDVLQSAYEQVTDARQKANEDENEFADRIARGARECCNVFRDRELVNYFIRGLLPATRDAVTERVRHLTSNEQGDLTVARRIAVAKSNTFRARMKVTTTAMPARTRLRSNTLFLGEPEASTDPSAFRRDPNIPHMFAGPYQYWADLRRETLSTRIRLHVSSSRVSTPALVEERTRLR